MTLPLALTLAATLTQLPSTEGVHELTFRIPDFGEMLYAISIPEDYDPDEPRPLVLALHPGGERFRYYGSAFMQQIVRPAVAELDAIVVAPDCPTRAWTDPFAERAVISLLGRLLDELAIDRRRILVTGFSLGGRGAWFMAARHPDLFTAAIPMAASTGDEPLDALGAVPTYVIQSRDDEVVPFAPAEQTARKLQEAGRPVRFEALRGLRHYEMDRYVDSLRRAVRWVASQWPD